MKAIIFDKLGGPDVMHLDNIPKPEVKPGTGRRVAAPDL